MSDLNRLGTGDSFAVMGGGVVRLPTGQGARLAFAPLPTSAVDHNGMAVSTRVPDPDFVAATWIRKVFPMQSRTLAF